MADVLFLCTGNLCRSPSAALLLGRQLAQAGIAGVTVHSAGIMGAAFGPPEDLVNEGLAFGIDLSDHVAREFDTGMSMGADLVIGMAREHVREVVLADAQSFARTFTLREIVRRGHEEGTRRNDESLGEWLARIHVGRRHVDLIGDSDVDDIDDPMGGSSDEYRRMLEDVSALTNSLRHLAWP